MKLKKIAALALAGVMAVSMLAGCANKPGSSEPTTEPASDLTASVIAKLDKDTTDLATFSASSDLKADVEKLVAMYGSNGLKTQMTSAPIGTFQSVDSELPTATSMALELDAADLANTGYKSYVGEDNKQTAIYAVTGVATGVSPEYAAKEIAKAIDNNVQTLNKVKSAVFQDENGKDARVTYTVTGAVEVFTLTDATTGVVSYYAVYTLTSVGAVANV